MLEFRGTRIYLQEKDISFTLSLRFPRLYICNAEIFFPLNFSYVELPIFKRLSSGKYLHPLRIAT